MLPHALRPHLLDAFPEPLFLCAEDGTVVHRNSAAAELDPGSGRPSDRLHDLLGCSERALVEAFALWSTGDRMVPRRVRARDARGGARVLRLEGAAVGVAPTRVLVRVGAFDVSASNLSRAERELREQSARLSDLRRRQDDIRAHCERLAAENDALRTQATTDALTGLHNRRAFDLALKRAERSARRDGAPLSVLAIDVDRFKAYNDALGHPEGDRCLKRVAAAVARVARRPRDVVARVGGEEFAVILEGTPARAGVERAHEARAAVEALALRHPANVDRAWVTVSVGVATGHPTGPSGAEGLLLAADEALYRAKAQGRNQVAWIVLPGEWGPGVGAEAG